MRFCELEDPSKAAGRKEMVIRREKKSKLYKVIKRKIGKIERKCRDY